MKPTPERSSVANHGASTVAAEHRGIVGAGQQHVGGGVVQLHRSFAVAAAAEQATQNRVAVPLRLNVGGEVPGLVERTQALASMPRSPGATSRRSPRPGMAVSAAGRMICS